MSAARPLSNLQQELLKIYGSDISEADLQHIKDYLARYFAEKTILETEKKDQLHEPMAQYQTSTPPIFYQIVDSLRTKSEAELKLLYIRLFKNELAKEWELITRDLNFGDASDEDIVRAIQKKRYRD